MIHAYKYNEGYVSIWFGLCEDYKILDGYLADIYFQEDKINELSVPGRYFLPENAARPCEKELIDSFHNEIFNRFKYDFGLDFDDDLREAVVFDKATNDMELMLKEFSYSETFIERVKAKVGGKLPQLYNAVVVLYDFKYDGSTPCIENEYLKLHYLCHVNYERY